MVNQVHSNYLYIFILAVHALSLFNTEQFLHKWPKIVPNCVILNLNYPTKSHKNFHFYLEYNYISHDGPIIKAYLASMA